METIKDEESINRNVALFRKALERCCPHQMEMVGVEFRFRHEPTGFVVATGAEFATLRSAYGNQSIGRLAVHQVGLLLRQIDELVTKQQAEKARGLAETLSMVNAVNAASGPRPIRPNVSPLIRPEVMP